MTIFTKTLTMSLLIVSAFITNNAKATNLDQRLETPKIQNGNLNSQTLKTIGENPILSTTSKDTPIVSVAKVPNTYPQINEGDFLISSIKSYLTHSGMVNIPIVSPIVKMANTLMSVDRVNELAGAIVDKYKIKESESQKIVHTTYEVSKEHEIPPLTMLAVIETESGFNPKAKNRNAVGLTQTLQTVHRKKFKNKNVYDIKTNINVGAEILAECYQKYDGMEVKALRCYHGDKISSYPNAYVRRVLSYKSNYLTMLSATTNI